ncbi:hypothetical protein [Paenibacillus anseongense]|uniref:hypothetical protein n=1 Tax=Paenibacillus anseongense TaxID=2682845 RepID=UPI002DB6646E|nr:hypothetical protein [Paenibacillus anseongense]MEC0266708.1 hypothetical protein [Paenibacillus anseongense]
METDFIQVKAAPQHKQTVQNFIFALYKGTIDEFWEMLADVDQMGLFAEYDLIRKSNMNDYESFRDYLESVREQERIRYSIVQNKCGITNMARIALDGEVYIYLFENIQTDVHYIAPSKVEGKNIPVRLAYNMKYEAETTVYFAHWKVRILANEYKTALNA